MSIKILLALLLVPVVIVRVQLLLLLQVLVPVKQGQQVLQQAGPLVPINLSSLNASAFFGNFDKLLK